MGRISKAFALVLVLIVAISCLTWLTVKPVNSQTTQTLPVPKFSVKFVDGSYDIPASTSTDPFTGQTVINPTQHINNQTIVLTIKYQTSLYQENGLYYQVQMRGHYSQEWANISHVEANPHSEYTIVTYAVDGNNATGQFDDYLNQVSSGGTVDYRIYAQTWVSSSNPYQMPIFWVASVSDWSPIQTITLTDGATSSSINTSPTPMPTPTVPEFSWLAVVPLLVTTLFIAVTFRRRKNTCI